MDTPELPIGYLEEGRAYLKSMQKLGLRPNAFFWAYDHVAGEFVLVLITEAFDAVGPLELSRLLFKAHNAHATPQAINPFIVRLHSINHQIVRELENVTLLKITPGATVYKDGKEITDVTRAVINVGGLEIDGDWVYLYEKPLAKRHSTTEVLKRFHRFEQTVNRMAA